MEFRHNRLMNSLVVSVVFQSSDGACQQERSFSRTGEQYCHGGERRMMRAILASTIALALSAGSAVAQVTCAGSWPPSSLTGGTTASAADVMANFNYLYNCLTGVTIPAQQSSGFVSRLRNGTFVSWPKGPSGTATVSPTGAAAIAANGWAVLPTGASATWAQGTGSNGAPQSLRVTGATGVTDVVVGQRIESADAIALAGKRVTFQMAVFNGTGGSITPTLATRYAGTADVWSSPVNDLTATNLQPCASGVWTTVAYTFNVAAGADKGYEIKVDFGNNFSVNTKYVQLTAADLRVTPGISTGLNASPPLPELLSIQAELARSSRYYQASYENGVAPGTSTRSGLTGPSLIVQGTMNGVGSIAFPTAMRSTPTVAYWDGAGNASKISYLPGSGALTYTDNVAAQNAPFNISTRGFFYTGYTAATDTSFLHYTAYADFW